MPQISAVVTSQYSQVCCSHSESH